MAEDVGLIQEILGIPELEVLGVEISPSGLEIRAEVSLRKGLCPGCGEVANRIHEIAPRRVRHLPWSGLPCVLAFDQRRLKCDRCSTTFVPPVDFLVTPDAQHTRAYAEWLFERVRGASIKVVARQEGIPEKTLEGLYYTVGKLRESKARPEPT